MDIFRNRVPLVTGAASGLGRGLALSLAASGAKVVAADIDEAGLATLAAGGVEAVALDVCPGFVDTGIYRRAEVQPGFDADSPDLLPFPRLETEKAIARILRGVARKRARIVFPAYWRWCWLLYRLHPALLSPGTRRLLAGARAAVAKSGA